MGARDSGNSLPAEPRVGLISRFERVPETAATHILQSQGWAYLASLKGARGSSNLPSAEPRVGQVSRLEKGARNSSNSHTAEPRVGLVSSLERVLDVKGFTPFCLTWAAC